MLHLFLSSESAFSSKKNYWTVYVRLGPYTLGPEVSLQEEPFSITCAKMHASLLFYGKKYFFTATRDINDITCNLMTSKYYQAGARIANLPTWRRALYHGATAAD